MEISSTSSATQATEILQVLLLKKAINAAQGQVLALIKSAMLPPLESMDSSKVGQLLDAKA